MRKIFYVLIAIFVTFILSSCSSADELTGVNSNEHIRYDELSIDLAVDNSQCDICNVFSFNDYYYAIGEVIPYTDISSNSEAVCNLYKLDNNGVLIDTIRLDDYCNAYFTTDLCENLLYYTTVDGRVESVDVDTGIVSCSVQCDANPAGVKVIDDGYVVFYSGYIKRYNFDNELISTVRNEAWTLYNSRCAFYSDNDTYYLISYAGYDWSYYRIDFDNNTCELVFDASSLDLGVTYCHGQYIFTSSGEYYVDLNSNHLIELASWNDIDMQPERCGLSFDPIYIGLDDESFSRIYIYEDGTSQALVYTYAGVDESENQEIVIGGFNCNNDTALKWAVYKFNAANTEYRAVIDDYSAKFDLSGDNASSEYASMLQYFSEGNSPDVFYGNEFDYELMFRNSTTQDMMPYMSDECREAINAITPSIRDLMVDSEGECYRVFSAYSLEGYITNQSVFSGNTNISYRDALNKADECDAYPIVGNMSVNIVYNIITNYIDKDTRLTEDELVDILCFSYEYGYETYGMYSIPQISDYSLQDYLLFESEINSLIGLEWLENNSSDGISYVGYLSENNSSHLVNPKGQVALSSGARYPDKCCELISYLLDKDVQLVQFTSQRIPVNQDFLEYACNASMDVTFSEDYSLTAFVNLYGEVSQNTVNDFLSAVYSADTVVRYDWGIADIVREEVSSYYREGRSPEEIAVTLKSRLDVYLNENY